MVSVLTLIALAFVVADKQADAGQVEASCYGDEAGPVTASGESFVPTHNTAAHRSLPFGTRLLVKHEGHGVAVTVNDRGPYVSGRDLDLSMAACQAVGLVDEGAGEVEVEQVESDANGIAEQLPETGGGYNENAVGQ